MFSYPLTWTTFLNLAALIEMPYFSSTSGSGASRGPETKTSLPLFSSKTTERVSGTVTSRSPSSRARLVLTARASFQSSKEHPAITRQKPTREGNQEDCSSRHRDGLLYSEKRASKSPGTSGYSLLYIGSLVEVNQAIK